MGTHLACSDRHLAAAGLDYTQPMHPSVNDRDIIGETSNYVLATKATRQVLQKPSALVA